MKNGNGNTPRDQALAAVPEQRRATLLAKAADLGVQSRQRFRFDQGTKPTTPQTSPRCLNTGSRRWYSISSTLTRRLPGTVSYRPGSAPRYGALYPFPEESHHASDILAPMRKDPPGPHPDILDRPLGNAGLRGNLDASRSRGLLAPFLGGLFAPGITKTGPCRRSRSGKCAGQSVSARPGRTAGLENCRGLVP